MALVKGENVYADDALSAADLYFAQHVSSEIWAAKTNDVKTGCLVTGTQILDSLVYLGTVASDLQTMSFPRVGEYFDVRKGYMSYFEDTEYPQKMVEASFEMALHLANNPDLLTDTGSLSDIDLKGLALKGIRSASIIPGHVYTMIRPFLASGANNWWRAN